MASPASAPGSASGSAAASPQQSPASGPERKRAKLSPKVKPLDMKLVLAALENTVVSPPIVKCRVTPNPKAETPQAADQIPQNKVLTVLEVLRQKSDK
jgi:hypothetical protein